MDDSQLDPESGAALTSSLMQLVIKGGPFARASYQGKLLLDSPLIHKKIISGSRLRQPGPSRWRPSCSGQRSSLDLRPSLQRPETKSLQSPTCHRRGETDWLRLLLVCLVYSIIRAHVQSDTQRTTQCLIEKELRQKLWSLNLSTLSDATKTIHWMHSAIL